MTGGAVLDWDEALSKIASRLAALRAAAVAAGTPSVQGAEAEQARKVEEDLAAFEALLARKKAFETSAEVRRLSRFFDEEASFLVARALAADEALRFQYTASILEKARMREAREREIFVALAMKLDYRDQEDAWRRLLLSRRAERIAPVVLCGDPDHGLYWVEKRLRRQVPPSTEPPFVLTHSFGASAIAQSIPTVMAAIAKRLGLPTSADRQRVFDKLCDRWRSTNIVLVFSQIERIGAAGFTRLLEELWCPLAREAGKRRPAAASTWIAAFFLHDGEPEGLTGAPVCRAVGRETPLETPVLLPRLGALDSDALARWQTDHGLELPESIQTAEAMDEVLAASGGVPGEVFYAICRHWEYDFTVLSDLWDRV
jgi:hypothetical protein